MAKPSSEKNGYLEVAKIFGGLVPAFDVEQMAGIQRKNLEAVTQANQLAADGIRALTLRQSEIMSRHAGLLSNTLYPNKSLQEREVAGVQFLSQHGRQLLPALYDAVRTDCLDHQLIFV